MPISYSWSFTFTKNFYERLVWRTVWDAELAFSCRMLCSLVRDGILLLAGDDGFEERERGDVLYASHPGGREDMGVGI